ncbi:MAG: hypothetical protein H6673_11815 [Anaerolineales bacterium]|nr:hypothetical protein [Anaerolineales bacterium]
MNIQHDKAYTELLNLLADEPTAEKILSYVPSMMTLERVRHLLDAYQAGTLTVREWGELEALRELVFYKRMLNIYAHKKLDRNV